MREKIFLVFYFFKIPFKFQLEKISIETKAFLLDKSKSENRQSFIVDSFQPESIFSRLNQNTHSIHLKNNVTPLLIENVPILSNIDYITEHGTVISKQSNDMKIKKIFIYKEGTKDTVKIDHVKSDQINNILSSSFVGIGQIFDPGIKMVFPLIDDIFSNKDMNRESDAANDDVDKNPFIDFSFEEMSFQVSKISYFMIRNFRVFGNTPTVVMNYSELRKTPFLITFFLHLPLALTSLMILVLILSFETGINKDVIYDEISKLPLQKYTRDMEFTECSICLENYNIGEEVRILSCKHCFHKNCIDSWLGTMLRCPICRKAVTKLAESPSYELYQSLNYIP